MLKLTLSDGLFFVTVATSIAAGFFLGLAGGTFDGAWIMWLKDWQTLLAGLLAIGAALVTVLQMNRTDERAQWRHEELIRQSLRADKLRALRASYPHVDDLRYAARDIRDGATRFEEDIAERKASDNKGGMHELQELAAELVEIGNRPDVLAAADLFDPNANAIFRLFQQMVRDVEETLNELQTARVQNNIDEIEESAQRLASVLISVVPPALGFAAELERLPCEIST